jgi:dolichol-phosphate mannosyltransferase
MMKPIILIPTFNEAEAILGLLSELELLHRKMDFDVLIIDDNSPDGTADLVDSYDYPFVDILHREAKSGLGGAYRAGISNVLASENYSHVITMDGDGSHQVSDLESLLGAQHSSNVSLTLGTRWMAGGSVVNWPLHRRILSRGGTAFAGAALGIPLADLTGGFRAYSVPLLRKLNFESIDSTGYCFQIEMVMASVVAGASIIEVPITFIERVNGVSKMSRAIVIEALWQTTLWGLQRKLGRSADKLHYVK